MLRVLGWFAVVPALTGGDLAEKGCEQRTDLDRVVCELEEEVARRRGGYRPRKVKPLDVGYVELTHCGLPV